MPLIATEQIQENYEIKVYMCDIIWGLFESPLEHQRDKYQLVNRSWRRHLQDVTVTVMNNLHGAKVCPTKSVICKHGILSC